MGKKKDEEVKKPEVSLEDQAKALEAEIQLHNTRVETFQGQLTSLEEGLHKLDETQEQDIEKILSGLPNLSPKGITDKILQISNPKRVQLTENINKIKVAIDATRAKIVKIQRNRASVLQAIQNVRFDEQAKLAFKKLEAWLSAYKDAEGLFDELKSSVLECEDQNFFTRTERLGYPKSFEVVCGSQLRRGYLPSLSMEQLAASVSGVTDYGPKLLERRYEREAQNPIVRDKY